MKKLFTLMRQLKDKGVGIILLLILLNRSEICDRITVLRNGELVGEFEVESLPRLELVKKMMGKKSKFFQISLLTRMNRSMKEKFR